MWDTTKTVKVLKGAGLAAVGAALAYGAAYVGSLDLGTYGPALAAMLAVLANAVRQALSESSPPAPEV